MTLFNKKKSAKSGNRGGGVDSKNATMLVLIVAALSLVIAPAVINGMARPAAALEASVPTQHSLAVPDVVGNLGGGQDNGGADNGNGNANGGGNNGCPPGAQCLIRGGASATKQFTLDISAAGKVSGSNALATVHVEGVVDIDSKTGAILQVQAGSVTGNAEIKDKNGNTAATYDFSNISLQANGAKLTVNANTKDQDNDTGKFTASLFADNKISGNSNQITLQNNNNNLSIKYDTVNQQFTSTGKNVEAQLNFT